MNDGEIKEEIIKAAIEEDSKYGGLIREADIRLHIHREKPPMICFQGWVIILSDGGIACLISRLPALQLAYDVYVWYSEVPA